MAYDARQILWLYHSQLWAPHQQSLIPAPCLSVQQYFLSLLCLEALLLINSFLCLVIPCSDIWVLLLFLYWQFFLFICSFVSYLKFKNRWGKNIYLFNGWPFLRDVWPNLLIIRKMEVKRMSDNLLLDKLVILHYICVLTSTAAPCVWLGLHSWKYIIIAMSLCTILYINC